MGTGRKFNKKPRTRPVKGDADRRRRERTQRKRLETLGMSPEVVEKMNAGTVRETLKRPAKIVASAKAE